MSGATDAQDSRSPHEPDELPPDIAARARRLLLDLVRPERTGYIVVIAVMVAFGVANAAGPALIAQAMDHGIPAAIAGNTRALVVPLTLFLLLTLLIGVLDFWGTRMTGTLAQRLMVALRRRLFDHVQRLGIAYHERSTSGRLVARQTSDMENIQTFLTGSLVELVAGLSMMGAIAVTLLVMDLRLAIVVFLGFIPLLWVSIAS
ncbi:MAG TPA: ABC transporter ATP-binding protein, partial [Brevibacterium senegalense]|nr:ABC transporter ATP-binding protein [Brevibacterium senegalense]